MVGQFLSSSQHTFADWQTEFEAVLLEGDSQNLPKRLEAAEAVISLRLKTLVNDPKGKVELVAIADAKRMMALVQDVDSLLGAKLDWHRNNPSSTSADAGSNTLPALSRRKAEYDPRRPFEKLLLNEAERRGVFTSTDSEFATKLKYEKPSASRLRKKPTSPNTSQPITSQTPVPGFSGKRTLGDSPFVHQDLSPGDRVEGLGNFGKPLGEFGTVEQANDDDVVVKWDDDGRMRIRQPWLQKL